MLNISLEARSLGIVLVDILEESNSATELLRNGEEWKCVSFGLEVSALVSGKVLDQRKRSHLPKSSLSLFIGFEDEWWVRKRCERYESWMELKTSAELVNKVPDSEKYGEFPRSLVEQFISLVLGVFCEIEADQESNSRASGGLRTRFIGVVFDTIDESLGRLRPCDPVLAPRASASEIELDAMIGEGRLVDSLCFTSSFEFVSVSLGFQELDSSKDFCVAFGQSN
ncbi:hypothetical protein F2Q69_00009763 [Brassica cretica]|uniref:Uncharacterized protein n=1 Tax=Brassica cretica TaxID=69181 RepID=A0A8S9PHC5_BRACR|nr:hypothetical protein F2Q69_00009763 [Brassica cretica]